jgi:hypothetical protein
VETSASISSVPWQLIGPRRTGDFQETAMLNPWLPTKARFQWFFDLSNYTVAPEGTVAVTVLLQETFNPKTFSSLLAPGTDGLILGGVLVEVISPLPSCPARVRKSSSITGNPAFDFATVPQLPVPQSATSAGILELSDSPVYGEVVSRSDTCETVLLSLGTFLFTAGTVSGEVNFLTAMVTGNLIGAPGDINVTYSGVQLDGLIQAGSAMITVSPKAAGPHFPGKRSSLADVLGTLSKDTGRRKS